MWNQSIESKRRWGNLNRDWLGKMISARAFEFAAARDPSGTLVVSAGLFRDKHRVQQLMSVSPPRSALVPAVRARTNRASCFLLWKTMLRFKEQGLQYFDFGGWYPGTEDIQLLGANAFKKSLGGQVVREFECEQIVTLKGWLLLTAARLIDRAREFRPKDAEVLEVHPNEATA
jgi:CelD/BcsL family acetyltransferase involved in cellulose biosynthesis